MKRKDVQPEEPSVIPEPSCVRAAVPLALSESSEEISNSNIHDESSDDEVQSVDKTTLKGKPPAKVPNLRDRFFASPSYPLLAAHRKLRLRAGGLPEENSPWLVIGNFNAIKDPSDRIGCSTNWISYFDEFPHCLARAELMDLRYVGCRFTWSTSSGDARKMRKIDRVLVNEFKAIVQQAWDSPVAGVSMYQLVSKLKRVKARLRSLNREAFSDISVKVFVNYFSDQLSAKEGLIKPSIDEVRQYVHKTLSQDQSSFLNMPVSDSEIKNTLFSLAKGKAPGPDGFSVDFYKYCWDSVGSSVLELMHDFFRNGRLLKEVNATTLVLVPKVPNASADSKCAIKVDFHKAFDTVDWDFLELALEAFRFPSHFIKLIMVQLSHLFFADDVFLFCQADWKSVVMLKTRLDLFSSWSGLLPNKHKSEIFMAGGDTSIRNRILWAFGFQEGKLPVRYLGVPIISSRLNRADCIALIDRITARIQSWTHRFLSFAGRLQLIRSVLHSIQAFWTSVFTLPSSVLADIERIMRWVIGNGYSGSLWHDYWLPCGPLDGFIPTSFRDRVCLPDYAVVADLYSR
ncbi:uncharacterized protein LOC120293745 [Eucalyptus grandis]|uniref:uncharacterized protein LOC120293745 n=1 Tax=Eucalyptus grandis TaxID=71139 RepID=UPI00192EFFF2|nr:uncharacterized protein LOC120293745 [Eucalyptus grandis]